jgi:hypothetical protein
MVCGAISDRPSSSAADRRAAPREPRRRRRFRAIAFWASTRRKNTESERILSQSETSGFATGGAKYLIIEGYEIGHFAELFIFNSLTPLFVSCESRAPAPAAAKAAVGRIP